MGGISYLHLPTPIHQWHRLVCTFNCNGDYDGCSNVDVGGRNRNNRHNLHFRWWNKGRNMDRRFPVLNDFHRNGCHRWKRGLLLGWFYPNVRNCFERRKIGIVQVNRNIIHNVLEFSIILCFCR